MNLLLNFCYAIFTTYYKNIIKIVLFLGIKTGMEVIKVYIKIAFSEDLVLKRKYDTVLHSYRLCHRTV
jgi:hypothetical protein